MPETLEASKSQELQPTQFGQNPFQSPEFLSGIEKAFKGEPESPAPVTTPPVVTPPVKTEIDTTKPATEKVTTPTNAIEEDPEDIRKASKETQSSWHKLKESKKAVEAEREKFRTEHEKASSDLKAAREEMEKLKAATPKELNLTEHPEYKRVKAELDEHVQKIRELDVRSDKRFKAYFDGRATQQLEIAKRAAGDRAEAVLKLPQGEYRDEQIEALFVELPASKGAQLMNAKVALEQLEMEREAAVQEEVARHEQRRLEREQQETTKRTTIEKAFDETLTAAREHASYKERDGDETWNKELRERIAVAKQIFSGQHDPRKAAEAALFAAAAPVFVKMHQDAAAAFEVEKTALNTKVSELEAEILKLRGASPVPGSDNRTDAAKTELKGMDAIMSGIRPLMTS